MLEYYYTEIAEKHCLRGNKCTVCTKNNLKVDYNRGYPNRTPRTTIEPY